MTSRTGSDGPRRGPRSRAMWAPHPAAFTTTWSASANADALRRARRRAVSSRPLCACSAPQQRWARGTITRQPHRVSTRIVARFTSWNQRSCTHPDSRATVPRTSVPPGGVRSAGSRRNGAAPRGTRARTRRGMNARASGCSRAATAAAPGAAERRRARAIGARARRACGGARSRCSRGFHHATERHVRRADVLAGAADEASIHERRERVVDLGPAVGDRAHRGDPASGRRRFVAGEPVGGAVGQAQAARDAGVEVGVDRVVGADPVRRDRPRDRRSARPRASRCRGSGGVVVAHRPTSSHAATV